MLSALKKDAPLVGSGGIWTENSYTKHAWLPTSDTAMDMLLHACSMGYMSSGEDHGQNSEPHFRVELLFTWLLLLLHGVVHAECNEGWSAWERLLESYSRQSKEGEDCMKGGTGLVRLGEGSGRRK